MKQLMAGILIGGIVVGGAGAGYLAYQASAETPPESICRHLLEVCDPDPDQVNAYSQCVADMDAFVEDSSDEQVERLTTCVLGADGCAEASGCLVGAGLGQAFGEVGEFFKGVGNALGLGKDR